jgi:hypothetical protein
VRAFQYSSAQRKKKGGLFLFFNFKIINMKKMFFSSLLSIGIISFALPKCFAGQSASIEIKGNPWSAQIGRTRVIGCSQSNEHCATVTVSVDDNNQLHVKIEHAGLIYEMLSDVEPGTDPNVVAGQIGAQLNSDPGYEIEGGN